jgi:uncharacterized RDD family membrane protein YckC
LQTEFKYRTVGKRFFAAIIDGLLFIPFTIINSTLMHQVDLKTLTIINVVESIIWTLYIVIAHGKYGHTVGKKSMKLKVLDLSEENLIGYWRAFLREAIPFFIALGTGMYTLSRAGNMTVSEYTEEYGGDLTFFIPLIWLVIEIVSALTNNKRRAVHDWIARSVVVRIDQPISPVP